MGDVGHSEDPRDSPCVLVGECEQRGVGHLRRGGRFPVDREATKFGAQLLDVLLWRVGNASDSWGRDIHDAVSEQGETVYAGGVRGSEDHAYVCR